jgi:hypothetical protein
MAFIANVEFSKRFYCVHSKYLIPIAMQQYPSQMKIPQRLSLSALVLVLFAGCEARREAQPDTSSRQSDTPTLLEESLEGYNKRMEWFVHAPYGMFIHFGLYSLLGGEWKGRQIDGYAEWIQALGRHSP